MRYYRPSNLLAGFHADTPDDAVPELVHVGEQWAPTSFFIPRHEHTVWEFYLQLDGVSRWESEGRDYILNPGGFFAAPPGVRHAMKELPRKKHHYLFAALDLERVLDRHPSLRPVWQRKTCIHFPNAQHVQGPFRQLIREVSMQLPLKTEGLRIALDYLVIESSRLFQHAGDGQALVPAHPAVQKTKEILEQHYAEPWRLADLGKLVGVSPNHLVQLFTAEVGVSPHQYLLRQRIERAKELLRQSDIAITQLALELGFSSSQHFAKMFRQSANCSARAFRDKFQRTHDTVRVKSA